MKRVLDQKSEMGRPMGILPDLRALIGPQLPHVRSKLSLMAIWELRKGIESDPDSAAIFSV